MLTRRQARLLGLTSGEDSAAGGANAAATSPPPPLATRIHGDAVPQRHGSPVAGSAASSPAHHGALPVSAAGTEGSVSAGAGGGGSTTLLLSGVAAFLHAQGTRTGSSSRGRLGARQAEAMLASAQAVVDRWAAAGTTAGPSIRPASDAVRQARGQHVTHTRLSPSTAGASSDRSSAASSSAEVHASGRPARLTAAQLRTRWRGVMRSCTSLQPSTRAAVGGGAAASDVTSGSPHTLQLLLTARPASPPPSASRGEGPSASSDDGALHTGVAVHDTPHTHPLLLEQVPGRGLGTVTLTPCFDAATRRAPVTALALRKRRDGIRAQRQERLSHEVHHQTYVKAHEARLRLLFGVGAVERSGGEEGHDAVVAGEAAYLQSLDSRRSDEEARVLRVIASIDAMLRQQLTSAYHRQQPETGGAPARELGGSGGGGADATFAARRPALMEAVVADAAHRVEAFTSMLLPYQQEGVRWLLRLNAVEHMNGILADDMGLGKTAQTVVYLSCYKAMVEEAVQQPLEELQRRHARLCQRALGLTTVPAVSGGGGGGGGGGDDGGVESVSEMPPWLSWCVGATMSAATTTTTTNEEEEEEAEEDHMGGARQTSQAAAATDASPLLSAARVCGGHVQLIKRVKQWLWQLEDGADVADGSGGSCRLAGRKRHLDVRGDAEDAGAAAAAEDADTSTLAPPPMTTRAVAVAAAAVTADPSLRRRRGRPPKHLSEMMAAAAAATARAALMPTPIQVGSAGLARMVAAQTQVSAFTAAMNGRLESGYRAFRPVLIIAPLSTLPHWADEFYRFSRRDAGAVLERFTVYVLNGSRPERESCMDAFLAHVERPAPAVATSPPPATPALVIPHDLLTRPQSGSLRHIRRVEWHVVVVDEAQRIKSARSTLFKRVGELRAVSRLALTGTPLQNNTTELFSLLRFVAPHAFASSDLFEQLDTALLAASRSSALEDRELHILLCRRVHRLLTPFILRREKSILKAALPPIRDYAVLCPLLPFQRAQLEEVERRHLAGALSGNPHVQYRKILLHPYTTQAFFYVDEEVVRTSGKLLVLDFMMRFLQRTEHKFLVFCGWTLVLDVVETLCGMRGIPYVRLDGRMSVEQRAANIKDFNHHHHHHNNTHISGGEGEGEATAMRPRRHPRPPAGAGAASVAGADSTGVLDGSDDVDYHGDGGSPPAPPPCCFLISKVAGGVGLNLQAADTVFLLDVDYNPQRDAQALSRVYRVGQTKEVRVLRLVIDHPVERDVVAIHEAKDNLGRAVVQAGRYDLRSSLQEREAALQSLFRAGALSQLSEQWATTTEAEEAPSLLSVCVPDAPGPHGDDDGGSTPAEAARDPPPRSQPTAVHPCTPTPLSALPRHVAAKAGMCAGAKEGRETSSVAHPCERCAPATTADGADDASGVSATAGPHRRLRRRVSFKLEGDDDDGGNNGEGRHRAGDEVLGKGAAPSSFSALPAAAAAADSEEERAAASAGSGGRALTPAEHLLAMRGRLAEVLLRHDGERHVLEDMFRSVERALRSESR